MEREPSLAFEMLPGHAVHPQGKFKHVMALALNPLTYFKDGVIRCITSREGDVAVSGFIDHSELHLVSPDGPYQFSIGERLYIKDEDMVIQSLMLPGYEFLGLEDPDLYLSADGVLHLYCTIPLVNRAEGITRIYLGHSFGPSLHELTMTEPVLTVDENGAGAKEVAIVPVQKDGVVRHLVESSAPGTDATAYSTVRVVEADHFNSPWRFGKTVFHPAEASLSWINGHASPGPFLPQDWCDMPNQLIGFINGREADAVVREQVVFGAFSVGLYRYDYEEGDIRWVSEKPFIKDREARTITFASQFVQTAATEGILYAHVDDSFVRAYRVWQTG
jgi:hypothetical protein